MRYETIADIYSANYKIRERLLATLKDVTADETTVLADGEKWSIEQVVEHLSMVENGALRICTKLLSEAKENGKPGDGRVNLSATFSDGAKQAANVKLEAPERVQPSGGHSIEDSLIKLKEGRDAISQMRPELERYDLSQHTFPHPYFGDLTAVEWLVVLGGHEARHTGQIERILNAIRQ